MPRTSGPGIKGSTTIGGVKHSNAVPKSGTNLAASGAKALYPSGAATNPKASGVAQIKVSTPKAGKRPSVHPVQRP